MIPWTEVERVYLEDIKFCKKRGGISLANIPCAFDIETTSYMWQGNKCAFMYIWMFGIEDFVFYGRTWYEFMDFIEKLSNRLDLNDKHRLVVYVHNLSFEFQFIYKLFDWVKVFCLRVHKPIYAIADCGIEFRCSYLLSGLSLEKVGDNLRKDVKKLSGYLDYSKVRHFLTPLTSKELSYCENDIKVLIEYIREQILDHHCNITYLPLTNTGRVRNYCRKQTLYKDYDTYSTLMRGLTLTPDEYNQLKRGFQGGFTHANYFYSGETIKDVVSYDFASSYPYVMVSEMFPMSSPCKVDDHEEKLDFYLNEYCCIFDIAVTGLESKTAWETPISSSRCFKKLGAQINNGRLFAASYIETTMTEQDYFTFLEYYDYESVTMTNFRIMKKDYLPKDFILSILKLYSDKTTLKDVPGKEAEYMRSKGMINSCYGMAVTDIARDLVLFQSSGWYSQEPSLDEEISKYNRSKRRFLYYPWGVWVTAYARRNLFNGISDFKGDYIYSDTDSVKVINAKDHQGYIESYNNNVLKKLKKMCYHLDIDFELCQPTAPNGKKKPLGVWDFDGHYKRFKTLGAKRYMFEKDDGSLSITVAGVNKKKAVPYLVKKYEDPFSAFEDGLTIPADYTGKLTHTYIDDEITVNVTDYNGVTTEVHCPSGIHLEPAEYNLSLSDEYIEFLRGCVLETEY